MWGRRTRRQHQFSYLNTSQINWYPHDVNENYASNLSQDLVSIAATSQAIAGSWGFEHDPVFSELLQGLWESGTSIYTKKVSVDYKGNCPYFRVVR